MNTKTVYFMYILLPVLISLSGISGQSQTLEECYRWTEGNYPLIENYDLINKAERFDMNSAANAWVPRIVISGQATMQSDVVSFPDQFRQLYQTMGLDLKGISKDQYKLAIDIEQPLWDGGKSKADKQYASADAATQSKDMETKIYALRSKVNDLYFGTLLLQEQMELNDIKAALLKSNITKTENLVSCGVLTAGDCQMLRAELLKTEQDKLNIRASLDAYAKMLSLFTGHEIGTLEEPEEPYTGQIKCLRPELELFELQMQSIDAKKKLLDSSLYPRFSFFAQGYYGYPGLNMFEDMLHRDFSLNGIVGVRMQWNISSFFTRKTDVGRLSNARDRIAVQRKVFEFNNNMEAGQINETIGNRREIIARDREIVDLRRSVRESYESRLENGIVDVNDLVARISEENQARISASVHRIELLKSLYELKTTLNIKSEE